MAGVNGVYMTDRELLIYVHGFLNGAEIDHHKGRVSAIYDGRSLAAVIGAISEALELTKALKMSKRHANVEITEEMLKAGADAVALDGSFDSWPECFLEALAARVYLAMTKQTEKT